MIFNKGPRLPQHDMTVSSRQGFPPTPVLLKMRCQTMSEKQLGERITLVNPFNTGIRKRTSGTLLWYRSLTLSTSSGDGVAKIHNKAHVKQKQPLTCHPILKFHQSLVDKFYTVLCNIFKQIYGFKGF